MAKDEVHEIFELFAMNEHTANDRMLRDCLYMVPRFHRSRESLISLQQFRLNSSSPAFDGYAEYSGYNYHILDDGTPQYRYPGVVEEIVEDALIKMASINGYIDNEIVSVEFSQYELKKELKSVGKTYSNEELRLILETLNKSEITLAGTYKFQHYSKIKYRALDYLSLKSTATDGTKTKCTARFSKFTSTRILNGEFNNEAYKKSMKLGVLSRHLYKLILRYRSTITYGIFKAPTAALLQTSPLEKWSNSDINRSFKQAFEELYELEIIVEWKKGKAITLGDEESTYVLTLGEDV